MSVNKDTLWRAIPGFPRYEINPRGRVRTLSGYVMPGNGKTCLLTQGGRRVKARIVDLVAMAFMPTSAPAQAENVLEDVPDAPAPVIVPVATPEPPAPAFISKDVPVFSEMGVPGHIVQTDKMVRKAAPKKKHQAAPAGRVRQHSRHTRSCTTCGKPTSDYRCAACWVKLRGYDANTANDRDIPFVEAW